MLFKDWYDGIPKNTVSNIYGDEIATWFLQRFGNYEMLYDHESFGNLFSATLTESHLELIKLKEFFEVKKLWELGNFVESSTYMVSDAVSDGTQSYQGYNVEGDFSKNSTSGKQNANTTGNTKSINITDEYNKILSFDYSKILDRIYSNFVKLFILVL